MGLVSSSKDVALVGTMTSGGTDVFEMPASTSLSTTTVASDGTVVSLEAMVVEETVVGAAVIATVVGVSVEATAEVVEVVDNGAPDGVGGVALEAHEAVRSARAPTHHLM
jgi:hypothetical protein